VVEKINAYKFMVGNHEGKRPPRRLWHKWVDNIKMVLKK
jgi:hypothetical protein